MSYTVEWITPIYDRSIANIYYVRDNPTLIIGEQTKGAMNAVDLNRIENNIIWIMENMLERKITRHYQPIQTKTNWINTDIPTRDDINRIINNMLLLQEVCNPEIWPDLNNLQIGAQMNYVLANAIEENLQILHDQPDVPIPTYRVTLENGIFVETGESEGNFEEDQVVHIQFHASGETAPYQVFQRWTGDTDVLQYLEDPEKSPTALTVWRWEDGVTITGQYRTLVPHTLTLNSAKLDDGTDRTTAEFYYGDVVPIYANKAPNDMVFYEWQGTQSALYNLTNGENASTAMFTMPDEDVTLTAFYIHPGVHKLTVNYGSVDGSSSGYFNYRDIKYITAEDRGNKYTFTHWTGYTQNLSDTQAASTTFNMPDVACELTANYSYNYSYNTITVVNGSGGGENIREGSTLTLIANSAPEGKGFLGWSISGTGRIVSPDSSTTQFIVGDGNCTITAQYDDLHTYTLYNANDLGQTWIFNAVKGRKYEIELATEYGSSIFTNFTEDGNYLTSNEWYVFTMGDEDRHFEAVYRAANTVNLTVNNGYGSGTYMERTKVPISANTAPSGKRFVRWDTNGLYRIYSSYSSSTTVQPGSSDCSVTAVYGNLPGYHNVTVINGSGPSSVQEYDIAYYNSNSPAYGYRFTHWTLNSGNGRIRYPYQAGTWIEMYDTDMVIEAHYELIPTFTLTVVGGSGSGTYNVGSQVQIIADKAEVEYAFLEWTGDVNNGELENTHASTTRTVSLSKNMTVYANYYKPQEAQYYKLTVDGDWTYGTGVYATGTNVTVGVDEYGIPEGYEFDRWKGDTGILIDRYDNPSIVVMPDRPCKIEPTFKRIGSTTKYTLDVSLGLCETIEEEISSWNSSGAYVTGDIVRIRANQPPNGWEFSCWQGDVDTIDDIYSPNTTIEIEDDDLVISAKFTLISTYVLTVDDGGTSGTYYAGEQIHLYFDKADTEDVKYVFTSWSGDTSLIDPTLEDQTFTMPARNVHLSANYTSSYHLQILNGKIKDSVYSDTYLQEGDTITIVADEPSLANQEFANWSLNYELATKWWLPQTLLTMGNYAAIIRADYKTIGEENNVGYTLLALPVQSIVSDNDINIIAGEIADDNGFLLTDNKGHIYIRTANDNTFTRFTKILKGGNIYE